MKPLLNFDRLDFVDATSTPTRSYPAMQAGEMRLLGSIAQQWQFLLDVVIRKSIQGHGQAQSVLKIQPQSKSFILSASAGVGYWLSRPMIFERRRRCPSGLVS